MFRTENFISLESLTTINIMIKLTINTNAKMKMTKNNVVMNSNTESKILNIKFISSKLTKQTLHQQTQKKMRNINELKN